MEGAKFQSWNSHTKKFCVFGEDGKLKTQVKEPLPGVEIRKDKPAAEEKEAAGSDQKKQEKKPDNPEPEKTRNSIFSKLFKKSGSNEATSESDSFLSDW